LKEQAPIKNDHRRWWAIAQAGVLTTGLLLFTFAIRPFCGPWNWEALLWINAVACAILIIALLAINHKQLRRTAKKKEWGFMGLGCFMLVIGLLGLCYGYYEQCLYERSPGCIAEAESDASLSPCTWVAMRLDRKIARPGGVKTRSKREFCLTDASGTQHRIELPSGTHAFNLAKEGETLEVQIWRESIVQVRVRNITSLTCEFPGGPSRLNGFLGLSLLWLFLSGPAFCFGLFAAVCTPGRSSDQAAFLTALYFFGLPSKRDP
jgi:hypothetical protein